MGSVMPVASPLRGPGLPESIMADSAVWLTTGSSPQPAPPYPTAGPVVDLSGYATHGIGIQPLIGMGGLVFDAVDDRISLGTNILNPRLAGARGLSAAILMRPLGLVAGSGRNQLFGFNINGFSSSISGWFTDSGKLVFGGRSQAADTFQSHTTAAAVAADGVEVFLCGVLDYAFDRLRIWVGERLVADQGVAFGADTYQPGTSSQADTIGATSAGTNPLNGAVRAFALFRKPLDPGEVARVRELMAR